jgi:hypothetical protein
MISQCTKGVRLKGLLRNRKANMNLAAILAIYLLTMAWLVPAAGGFAEPQAASGQAESSPQANPSQPPSSEPAPRSSSPAPAGKTIDSTDPAKPSSQPHRRHKKKLPDCTSAATPLNPATNSPGNSENQKALATGSSNPASTSPPSSRADSTTADSAKADSAKADSAKPGSAPLPPCSPPKKVIRNGGSEEPTIQLIGGSPAQQASNQRSTEQLTAATQENLKKIAERQLSPSRQEMVNQVKQFMDQSKIAVAAGDLERGHNLAQKAHLLSEELVKP